jgi:hypothetical protein
MEVKKENLDWYHPLRPPSSSPYMLHACIQGTLTRGTVRSKLWFSRSIKITLVTSSVGANTTYKANESHATSYCVEEPKQHHSYYTTATENKTKTASNTAQHIATHIQ